jgi:hypothetical protein
MMATQPLPADSMWGSTSLYRQHRGIRWGGGGIAELTSLGRQTGIEYPLLCVQYLAILKSNTSTYPDTSQKEQYKHKSEVTAYADLKKCETILILQTQSIFKII